MYYRKSPTPVYLYLGLDFHHLVLNAATPARTRCHPGDDQDHERAGCAVVLEDVCAKGHTSKRRCTKDPVRPPCKTCEREAAAIEFKLSRQAESDRLQQEQWHQESSARPVEMKSTKELEHEELTRRMGLMFNWGGRYGGRR